jgi:hypothetical protein
VTFATLLDPERTWLECLIDVNPAKQGRFIPLSGHPVLSVEAARRAGVATAFVVNPYYFDEIRLMVAEAGASMELVAVQGAEDALHV